MSTLTLTIKKPAQLFPRPAKKRSFSKFAFGPAVRQITPVRTGIKDLSTREAFGN